MKFRISTLMVALVLWAGFTVAQNSPAQQEQSSPAGPVKKPAASTPAPAQKLNHVPGYGDSPDAVKTAPINGVKNENQNNKVQKQNTGGSTTKKAPETGEKK
jgi:hypothetical protein